MIVAEIGSNWYSRNDILSSIEVAAECGADAIKLQLWTDLYSQERAPEQFLMSEKFKLPFPWLQGIKDCCRGVGVEFHLTVFNPELFEIIPTPDAVKIASGCLNYPPLLKRAAVYAGLKGIPLVLSTGTHNQREVDTAIAEVTEVANLVILNCVSLYPAQPEHYDLDWMMRYQCQYRLGVSDHTITSQLAEDAINHQVYYTWFEKHFTLPYITDAPDVTHALTPEYFKRYIEIIERSKRRFDHDKPVHPQEAQERLWMQRGEDGLRPRTGSWQDV